MPGVCREQHTAKARYTVCLAFAVCLGRAHGKSDICRVLLTANFRTHGKGRLSGSALEVANGTSSKASRPNGPCTKRTW